MRYPITRFEQHQDLASLWQLLQPLGQEVLALQIWAGLTGRKVAAVLGISRAACSMRASPTVQRVVAACRTSLGITSPAGSAAGISNVDQRGNVITLMATAAGYRERGGLVLTMTWTTADGARHTAPVQSLYAI